MGTITSGFYPGKKYSAADWIGMVATFFGSGVVMSSGTALQVNAYSGMTVSVNAGGACNDSGCHLRLTGTQEILLSPSNSSAGRIDRVVARWSTAAKTAAITLIQGSYSAAPVAPSIVRDGTIFDLSLATIAVGAGVTSITQAMITDTRLDTSVCGICLGAKQPIDTSVLFSQFTTEFTDLYALYTSPAWVAALKGKDGENGGIGATGAAGLSAYQVWLSLGNTGTEQDYINSLKGEDGKGLKILDNYNTLSELQAAHPSGLGLDGGFMVGLDYYYWGLSGGWISAGQLKGATGNAGTNGTNGKTAFESAVTGGFTGTETVFNTNLASIGNINTALTVINTALAALIGG